MDDIINIFKSDKYKTPIILHSNDFKSEVNTLLSSYIIDLEKHGVDNDIISSVKRFRRSCTYSLSNYFKG